MNNVKKKSSKKGSINTNNRVFNSLLGAVHSAKINRLIVYQDSFTNLYHVCDKLPNLTIFQFVVADYSINKNRL